LVIEWLRFRVPVADQAHYIARDAAIWTATLARYPGFLGKEVWCHAADPDTLNLVIRWESRAAWKAVPQDALDAADAAFVAAMGCRYPVLECVEYMVR
jgi:uncharacterized protein (TIGR03792 family)